MHSQWVLFGPIISHLVSSPKFYLTKSLLTFTYRVRPRDVPLQTLLVGVLYRAPFALEHFLLRVRSHVLLQMARCAESFGAHFTAEWLLPRVNPHMLLQLFLKAENLPTVITVELLQVMHGHVLPKIHPLLEHLVTNVTLMLLFGVQLLVNPQNVSADELFATKITSIAYVLMNLSNVIR